MPATVIIVLADAVQAERVANFLRVAGHFAFVLTEPHDALDTLDRARSAELLVTQSDFPAGQPNGLALARMARRKAQAMRVLFIGNEAHAVLVEGIATLIKEPVTAPDIAAAALAELEARSCAASR